MSNLLDQAIIDAEALKEVAMKNAEATILEKFSDQIKEAVEQILDEEPGDEDSGIEGMEADQLDDEAESVLDQLDPGDAEGAEMCACPDLEDQTIVKIDLDALEAGEEDGAPRPSEKVADEIGKEEDSMALPELNESFEIDEDSLQEFIFEKS